MTRRVFTPDDSRPGSLYPLLTATIVPRPIAWVSTLDADGVGNLAPHSFFTVASTQPPVICFTSVGEKDSLRNIEATGEFVVSVASEPLMEQVNGTSAPYPADVDEAAAVGLRMEPSATVRPPRVADSPASLECRRHSVLPIGDCWVVFGEVLAITVEESALDGDHPRIDALAPLARLGRDEWGLAPVVTRLERPWTV